MKYTLIVITGIVFWWVETWYFGWNMKPESALEAMADGTAGILIVWGIIGDLLKNTIILRVGNLNINEKYEGNKT